MLNIRVKDAHVDMQMEVTGMTALLAEVTIAIKSVRDALVEKNENIAVKAFDGMFEGSYIHKWLTTSEDVLLKEDETERKQKETFVNLAESLLIDDESDEIGKRIVECLKKLFNMEDN